MATKLAWLIDDPSANWISWTSWQQMESSNGSVHFEGDESDGRSNEASDDHSGGDQPTIRRRSSDDRAAIEQVMIDDGVSEDRATIEQRATIEVHAKRKCGWGWWTKEKNENKQNSGDYLNMSVWPNTGKSQRDSGALANFSLRHKQKMSLALEKNSNFCHWVRQADFSAPQSSREPAHMAHYSVESVHFTLIESVFCDFIIRFWISSEISQANRVHRWGTDGWWGNHTGCLCQTMRL